MPSTYNLWRMACCTFRTGFLSFCCSLLPLFRRVTITQHSRVSHSLSRGLVVVLASRIFLRPGRTFPCAIFPATIFLLAFAGAQTSRNEPGPLAAQADAARQNGDIPHAIDLYSQALRSNPSWPDGWWYLGQMHYAANDYAQAVDAFTHYLNLVPNAAPATALRGLCEFEIGQYDASLRDLEHALALGAADDSRNAQILRYHQTLLLTRLGRFEEAFTAADYFAKQHLSSPDLYVALGLAALRIPQLPASIDDAQREKCAAAGHAVFLLQSGDAPAANDALQQFFARYPRTANLHYTWGYLLYSSDQDAAIAEFRRELTLDPQSAVAHSMLAWALLMDSDPAAALPEARQAAVEAPALPLAQLSLGRALLETGDTKASLPVLESALSLDPGNLEVHLALARAYSESGREQDARRERLAALKMTEPTAKETPAMGQQGQGP